MTSGERTAAEALLQFSLSEVGYQKAHNIMQLETVLRQIIAFFLAVENNESILKSCTSRIVYISSALLDNRV
jgi:hypothetical protein